MRFAVVTRTVGTSRLGVGIYDFERRSDQPVIVVVGVDCVDFRCGGDCGCSGEHALSGVGSAGECKTVVVARKREYRQCVVRLPVVAVGRTEALEIGARRVVDADFDAVIGSGRRQDVGFFIVLAGCCCNNRRQDCEKLFHNQSHSSCSVDESPSVAIESVKPRSARHDNLRKSGAR